MKELKKGTVKNSRATEPPCGLDDQTKTTQFKEHDLRTLPEEALPLANGSYKGKHSYTVIIGQAVLWLLIQSLFLISQTKWIITRAYVSIHGMLEVTKIPSYMWPRQSRCCAKAVRTS